MEDVVVTGVEVIVARRKGNRGGMVRCAGQALRESPRSRQW